MTICTNANCALVFRYLCTVCSLSLLCMRLNRVSECTECRSAREFLHSHMRCIFRCFHMVVRMDDLFFFIVCLFIRFRYRFFFLFCSGPPHFVVFLSLSCVFQYVSFFSVDAFINISYSFSTITLRSCLAH